ncbi:MAG: hypothetical protein IJ514_03225 [Clostridia bacterium]|nr:hypothetical protein [Clostridia bacterium]
MKTIKKIIIALAFASLSLIGVACSDKDNELSGRVANFEVVAQDTVEIGQYYTPAMPQATLDGKPAVVSLSATQNGKNVVFNAKNALLVEAFEDITITYTIAKGEEKLEKNTVLKVQDTTAPYIVTTSLPESVYRGVMFNVNDYIRVGDLSGIMSENSLTITDNTGAEVATENGVFTLPENSPITSLKLAIKAKDGKDNSAEKTLEFPVIDAPYWNAPIHFNAPEMSKILAVTSGTSVGSVEKNGESALKVSHTAIWSGSTSNSKTIFRFTEKIANYTCFDYVRLVVSAKTDCNIDIPRAMKAGATEHIKFSASAQESEKVELFYDMDWIKNSDTYAVSGNMFQLQVRLLEAQHRDKENPNNHPTGFNVELYIYELEFGYYTRLVSDQDVLDLTKFGIQANEIISATFTPEAGGDAQPLDLAGWIPEKGTLRITLKKAKYKTTTVEIPIVPAPPVIEGSSDEKKDTDVEYPW